MNFRGVAIAVLLWPVTAVADTLGDLKARRPQVDTLLIAQKVYEAADGFLRENPSTSSPVAAAEKQTVAAENADRSKLFAEIAGSDGAIADPANAGKTFAQRYIGRYAAGVLREDPSTGELFDSWPPVRKNAATMLDEFFRELDRQEG